MAIGIFGRGGFQAATEKMWPVRRKRQSLYKFYANDSRKKEKLFTGSARRNFWANLAGIQ
jgi:hypothetical protein